MTPHLLATYASNLRELTPSAIENPQSVDALIMSCVEASGRNVKMVYAPFDHVNHRAKIVIVGMTPGRFQAANALRAAQQALRSGRSIEQAAAEAKIFASFSGEPMRGNLERFPISLNHNRTN